MNYIYSWMFSKITKDSDQFLWLMLNGGIRVMLDGDITDNLWLMLNANMANKFAYVCAGNVTHIPADSSVIPKEPLKGTFGNQALVYGHDMYSVSQLLLIYMWIEHTQ